MRLRRTRRVGPRRVFAKPATRCWPLWLALGAAVTAVAGACPHACADELRFTLSYDAPPECPSGEVLQGAVRRLATAETKPYSATVVVARDQEHFTARITAGDGTERVLVGSTCDEVAEATAVVLALAISPTSSQPPSTDPALKDVGLRPVTIQAPVQPLTTSAPVRLKLGTSAVFDLGTMPHVDLGVAGRVGATGRTWSAAVEGAYWLLSERRMVSQNSELGGTFSWWSLAAIGCLAVKDGFPRVELCAGPELGRVAGHGFGFPEAHDAAGLRFGLQAMAEVHVPLSKRLRLRAGVGAATVLFGRHDFYINGLELYHPQLVAGRAALGADFIF